MSMRIEESSTACMTMREETQEDGFPVKDRSKSIDRSVPNMEKNGAWWRSLERQWVVRGQSYPKTQQLDYPSGSKQCTKRRRAVVGESMVNMGQAL